MDVTMTIITPLTYISTSYDITEFVHCNSALQTTIDRLNAERPEADESESNRQAMQSFEQSCVEAANDMMRDEIPNAHVLTQSFRIGDRLFVDVNMFRTDYRRRLIYYLIRRLSQHCCCRFHLNVAATSAKIADWLKEGEYDMNPEIQEKGYDYAFRNILRIIPQVNAHLRSVDLPEFTL